MGKCDIYQVYGITAGARSEYFDADIGLFIGSKIEPSFYPDEFGEHLH
jgi:hypothetical protein